MENSSDSAHILLSVKKYAGLAGFNEIQCALVTTAVSELITNIFKYAGRGSIHMDLISQGDRQGIRILAEDDGPGIADIGLAMNESYSSGDSLGLGLPSVKRIMDSFEIQSAAGMGTRIQVVKWRELPCVNTTTP